jgi:hypothetical protein
MLTLPSHKKALIVIVYVLESPFGEISRTGCCCGLGCLEPIYAPVCYDTLYWPRVDVTVTNKANSESVLASIYHDSDAPSETSYRWTASIPLAVRNNRIVARADDGMGNQGSDVFIVNNP